MSPTDCSDLVDCSDIQHAGINPDRDSGWLWVALRLSLQCTETWPDKKGSRVRAGKKAILQLFTNASSTAVGRERTFGCLCLPFSSFDFSCLLFVLACCFLCECAVAVY